MAARLMMQMVSWPTVFWHAPLGSVAPQASVCMCLLRALHPWRRSPPALDSPLAVLHFCALSAWDSTPNIAKQKPNIAKQTGFWAAVHVKVSSACQYEHGIIGYRMMVQAQPKGSLAGSWPTGRQRSGHACASCSTSVILRAACRNCRWACTVLQCTAVCQSKGGWSTENLRWPRCDRCAKGWDAFRWRASVAACRLRCSI